MTEEWMLALVREFSPKVVPVDVDGNGLYREADTRWRLNPTWAAVPREIRERACATEAPDVRAYWDRIELEPA